MQRIFRKSLDALVPARKILLRLLQSELENRGFVDSIEFCPWSRRIRSRKYSLSLVSSPLSNPARPSPAQASPGTLRKAPRCRPRDAAMHAQRGISIRGFHADRQSTTTSVRSSPLPPNIDARPAPPTPPKSGSRDSNAYP